MNDTTTAQSAFLEALTDEATVTVTLESGRVYTGTPAEHPTEPGRFKIKTGLRGRPPVFGLEDVAEVVFE
jgi:hypothetical protein